VLNHKKVNQQINSGALPSFDKEGHRGCRGLMPENTIPAMLKAIDLGVTTLEMDAVVTKDKKIILSHEPFFNHEITTKPDGKFVTEQEEKSLNIYQMEYTETQKYDVGLKPHPRFSQQQKIKAVKPLLADLIDKVEKYISDKKLNQVFYNIETKSQPATDNIYHPEPAEFVELLVAVIKSKGIENRVIIQSFDFRTLQYLHLHYPSIKTAMLIEDFDKRGLDEQLKALGFSPTIYSPDYSLVNNELLTKCHEQKIKVIPWTVDDKPTIEKLRAMGVDGIITDYPNFFNG
jgi:glycerophosphoryl diester phosphodiesterase